MKVLKRAFDLYLKSSIHVALAVVAFAAITYLNFELHPNTDLLLFIFFGSVTGYNFVKYAQIAKFHHFNLRENLRIIQLFSLFCFIGLVWFAFQQSVYVLAISALLALLTAVYALPVFGSQTNLRSISGVKIFVIALVWAGVTVILPLLNTGQIFRFEFTLPFIQRTLFVIVLTLPFDIRDLRVDHKHLGTMPQQFGIKKTLSLTYILLAVVVLLEFLMQPIDPGEMIILIIMTFIAAVLVKKSVHHRSKYFTSFWVEGIPILWWALLVIV